MGIGVCVQRISKNNNKEVKVSQNNRTLTHFYSLGSLYLVKNPTPPPFLFIFEKLDKIQCFQGWKTWKEHNTTSLFHMRSVLSEQLVRDAIYIICTKTYGGWLVQK